MKLSKAILVTGAIAGSLDITGACLSSYIIRGTHPTRVLQYIASAVFGKQAYDGTYGMMAMGLLFHFIIAFSCTIVFFWCYRQFSIFRKSWLLNAVLISLAAWAVTNLLIIPLTLLKPAPFTWISVSRAIGILFLCIGIPISLMAKYTSAGRTDPK